MRHFKFLTPSIEHILNNFETDLDKTEEVRISTLTSIIDQALLKLSGSSLTETEQLEPLVHELLHYVKMAGE